MDLIYIKEVIFGGGIPMGLTTFLLAIREAASTAAVFGFNREKQIYRWCVEWKITSRFAYTVVIIYDFYPMVLDLIKRPWLQISSKKKRNPKAKSTKYEKENIKLKFPIIRF